MWPSALLDQVCVVLFGTEEHKLKAYYQEYVLKVLRPRWTSECVKLTGLIDLRDFAEDTLALLAHKFDRVSGIGPLDLLIKNIKATQDASVRRSVTVQYLQEQALTFGPSVTLRNAPHDLVGYVLEQELEVFFRHARDIIKYRPLVSTSPEVIEAVVKDMDAVGPAATLDHFMKWSSDMGLKTLWHVLALWAANQRGDVEDLFMHVPMPRVFGHPSCVRNAIEKKGAPRKLCKATAHDAIDMDRVVLAGQGRLTFKANGTFQTMMVPQAHLVAVLPGCTKRLVWCVDPRSMSAAIVDLGSAAKLVEFDLPRDDGEANWIDCQRDSEGTLVLMWGHINALTGALSTQNYMGLASEEALDQFVDPVGIPARTAVGSRIDFRDHGNLLAVHHTVAETIASGRRTWTHSYQVVFGDHQIMDLTSTSRPIEAIFGSPLGLIMLSPLSASSAIQLWALEAGPDGHEQYVMRQSSSVPALSSGYYTSVTVA